MRALCIFFLGMILVSDSAQRSYTESGSNHPAYAARHPDYTPRHPDYIPRHPELVEGRRAKGDSPLIRVVLRQSQDDPDQGYGIVLQID